LFSLFEYWKFIVYIRKISALFCNNILFNFIIFYIRWIRIRNKFNCISECVNIIKMIFKPWLMMNIWLRFVIYWDPIQNILITFLFKIIMNLFFLLVRMLIYLFYKLPNRVTDCKFEIFYPLSVDKIVLI